MVAGVGYFEKGPRVPPEYLAYLEELLARGVDLVYVGTATRSAVNHPRVRCLAASSHAPFPHATKCIPMPILEHAGQTILLLKRPFLGGPAGPQQELCHRADGRPMHSQLHHSAVPLRLCWVPALQRWWTCQAMSVLNDGCQGGMHFQSQPVLVRDELRRSRWLLRMLGLLIPRTALLQFVAAYQARNEIMRGWAAQQRKAHPERAPFPAFVDFDAMSRDPLAPSLLVRDSRDL